MEDNLISFIRQKDYILEKEIGQGGLGKTVLLRDPMIDEVFVCKKYSPQVDSIKSEYYENFKSEIKTMHKLFHKNIIRIFSYYLYPSVTTGYILMDYIDGSSIADYLDWSPEEINSIFLQIIDAFQYLQENNILHRDIRPQNIMVTRDGVVKIIDFGFGKIINSKDDFEKSISINWWCEIPNDFNDCIYDYTTEVYFVGKLIEQIINESNITLFKYSSILSKMIIKDHDSRIKTFKDIHDVISNETYLFDDLFSESEKETYRIFMDQIKSVGASVVFV